MRRQIDIPKQFRETACLQYCIERPGQWVIVADMSKALNLPSRSIGRYLALHTDVLERKIVYRYPVGNDVLYRYRGDTA